MFNFRNSISQLDNRVCMFYFKEFRVIKLIILVRLFNIDYKLPRNHVYFEIAAQDFVTDHRDTL